MAVSDWNIDLIPLIEDNLEAIASLCEKFAVRRLDLFGSAANGRFNSETSDLDFVVDFADKSPGYARRYIGLADALEHLLGKPIDLVTEGSIKNPVFRESVEASREVVFRDKRNRRAAA
jgi:predicted nucleotidyltransferase